jgi:beta-galactosidase
MKINMDFDWKFHKGIADQYKFELDMEQAIFTSYDDEKWDNINIPHDWNTLDEFDGTLTITNGYLPRSIGWYRKHFKLDPDYRSKKVFMEFEGIFRNSKVWINGSFIGQHESGYTSFIYDITDYVRFGNEENLLAVKVDAREGEGWWYEGCGIYRHVWLIVADRLHVSNWGTFVYTQEVSESSATIEVKTRVKNELTKESECNLTTSIVDDCGETVREKESIQTIIAGAEYEFTQTFQIENPHLWSPEDPYLYKAHTIIKDGHKAVDEYITAFGIRWYHFDTNKGFFLNGKKAKLRGMNIHHDYAGVGVALPDRLVAKNIEIIKDMGCNFLRSSHNAATPLLLEMCDRIGLLVWEETRYLDDSKTAINALKSLIRRDRNHPSIVCWGLANTAGDVSGKRTGILETLNAIAHQEDPTRLTAIALEGNCDYNINGFANVTDIVGYNGGGMGKDDEDRRHYPKRKVMISEYSSGLGTRGAYKTEGNYYSEYELCLSHEKEWRHVNERDHLAGGSMWSGIEYRGECHPAWPSVTSQFGVLDLCRFRKDAYYFYLSQWTEKAMIHLFPHWTWPGRDGEMVDVWCYSNCETVELFINQKSYGIKQIVPGTHLAWNIPYEPGVLKGVGKKNGKMVCEKEIYTADKPAKILLSPDRDLIGADGKDVACITVSVVDSSNHFVPAADNLIFFKIKGEGKMIGVGNGNPISHESQKARCIETFNGLCLVIVQSNTAAGDITITASSDDLVSDSIVLKSVSGIARG